MRVHEFTPDQKERILDAVSSLLSLKFSFYPFAKFVNDLCSDRIVDGIEYNNPEEPNTDKVITHSPDYLERIVLDNSDLQGFFFELQRAVEYKSFECKLAEAKAIQRSKSLQVAN